MKNLRHRWADRYGAQWYKHYDGKPPLDDDNDYVWNVASQQWELLRHEDDEE